jgi:CRISPR type IV-associated DEAD/DEAH-box helicase Csf4
MNITILVPSVWLTPFGVAEHLQSDLHEVTAKVKEVLLHVLANPIDDVALKQQEQGGIGAEAAQRRVMVSLPTGPSSVLNSFASMQGLTVGPMAKLLLGMVARGQLAGPDAQASDKTVPASHPMAVLNHLLNRKPRGAQAKLYDDLWESLTSGRIGMVEGGTGIGKTRAMMGAAVRWVQEKGTNVGICAPTLALLRQLVAEHKFQQEHTNVPELRLMIGRREYVSELELLDFLGGRGAQWDTPQVREWIKGNNPYDTQANIDTDWQINSLLQVAPDIPVDEVRIGDLCSTADRGFKAYRAQFCVSDTGADGRGAQSKPEILLFTHSMLAQDMRRKLILAGQDETYAAMQKFYNQALRNVKGKKRVDADSEFEAIAVLESELGVALNSAVDGKSILPLFSCLMVDEGHLLDESFSSSMSDYLSLAGLLQDLKSFTSLGGKVPGGGIDTVERGVKALIANAPGVDKRDFVALDGDSQSLLVPYLASIAVVCDSISNVRDESSEKYRLALKIRRAGVVLDIAANRNRQSSFLRHSPVRHLPQVFVSNANVQTILSRLWSSLESAALVSATLYIPTSDGYSANFMANLLRVPLDRLKTFAPVYAPWTTSCITGLWIAQSSSNWLYPPIQSDPTTKAKRTNAERLQAEVTWHEELAVELQQIWSTSAGGVLVLCTSYATVHAVRDLLLQTGGKISDAIVSASPRVSMRSQAQAFLQLSHNAVKPLWLAVGSAWTGVDIGGHDPWRVLFGEELKAQNDNVLTDLVIPRLPYGTNQSLSHLWRIRNNPNVPWDLFDASLRFKQALGRLVRRESLPKNRRIFVLDARLGDQKQVGRLVPFMRSLAKYKKLEYTQSA